MLSAQEIKRIYYRVNEEKKLKITLHFKNLL